MWNQSKNQILQVEMLLELITYHWIFWKQLELKDTICQHLFKGKQFLKYYKVSM